MSRGTRTATLAVATLLLAPLLVVGGARSAAAAVPVPDDATITLVGHGSGHGKGLSQYGAYSAARQGRSDRQILRFYYPGTQYGTKRGDVRVRIQRDTDRDLRIDAVRGLRVTALTSGRTRRPAVPRARQWRAVLDGRTSVVSYRASTWRVWRRIRGPVQFSAGRTPLTLRTRDGAARYRGALRSVRSSGQRITVNVLPLESYLRGVVPAEMQAGWPQQALRAQAVAARTYAAFERSQWRSRSFDLCDTSACQAYDGVSAEQRATTRAVTGTARRVLTYAGDLAFAQYSASNGGWTVDGDRPYLPAKEDVFEGTSSDYYGWRVRVSAAKIEKLYGLENLTAIEIVERDGNGTWGGRVTDLQVTTEGGSQPGTYSVGVDRFVSTFGLKSSLFRIRSAG